MNTKYYLYRGPDNKEHFTMPPSWSPVYFVENEERQPTASVGEMALQAIGRPVGGAFLADVVSGKGKVAIIVDDVTRPTPVREILDVLLLQLDTLGVPSGNISIVVACGTHVAMGGDVLEARVGTRALTSSRVVQHNAWQNDLVPVEIPDDGRVVMVNPVVAGADVRIGISSILPHPMAGYGGGPKILMPGVCGIDFIMRHHMKNAVHPDSRPSHTRGNPFHEECMKVARIIGLDFSINCVYDPEGRLASVIAGSLDGAFAAAIEACFQRLGFRWQEKVDVTITSSYPHSHGIQFYKGLGAADVITRPEGAILLFAPLTSPVPEPFIREFKNLTEKMGTAASAYVTDVMSQGKPFLTDQSAEFNMAMSVPLRRPRIRTVLVSPMVPPETALLLGFEYAPTLEAGIATLREAYPQARVALLPSGGLAIPIAEGNG